MTSLWIAVAATVGAALGATGLAAWLFVRHERASAALGASPGIDPESMEPLIEFAAERWAAVHGRPEAAGLVADKLRTLYGITYGRQVMPRRRWWSR